MAEAMHISSPDLLTCSICLEVLNEPVCIPCGHNYCMFCINKYWETAERFSCPQCREIFPSKPKLSKNITVANIVEELKTSRHGNPTSQMGDELPEAECDLCTWKKLRAVKFCVSCKVYLCGPHIQNHKADGAQRRHKLVRPSRNRQNTMCLKHQKRLDVFCLTDQICVCQQCATTEHKKHVIMDLERARAEKQIQLGIALCQIRLETQDLSMKLKKMQENSDSVQFLAEREMGKCKDSFKELLEATEKTQMKVMDQIKEQKNTNVWKADRLMRQMKEELEEVNKREAKLTQLSEIHNHIQFLQSFPFLHISSQETKDFSITIDDNFSFENLRLEVSSMKERVDELSKWNFRRPTEKAPEAPISNVPSPIPSPRDALLPYACSLTLNPNTANKNLYLFKGNREVTCIKMRRTVPAHPARFDNVFQVLCSEGLFGSRFYWEVERCGEGAVIGVTYFGIDRKGKDASCIIGHNDKSWSLFCSDSSCAAYHNDQEVVLNVASSHRIGVYLDWPANCLSFYSISQQTSLLHRFRTNFTGPLYPAFSLYPDSHVRIVQVDSPFC
ncbi:tripartite motif-containing protein 16-like isoform X2 [Erpetoichthys calabaricus]|uniref:tripartite motif-containing protein 16-like isoform X2 n=1 Tax=Erpetoichthys calabaricus TaxID=27687 RepID=UPI00109EF15C|nr:tripartite motif-containing protein 16-like isoform X2 [Erpetoichthys calabaricus]